MTPHPTQIEPLKRLSKIVNNFLSRPDIGPFMEPVDWRGLGLDDYPEIVKKMMDLGTVRRKLDRKQYYTATECADDIRLIWSNCMAYNADGSDFWLLAKSLGRRFEDRYRKVRQEFDCGADLKTEDDDPDAALSSSKTGTGTTKEPAAPLRSSSCIMSESPGKPLPVDVRTRFGANLFLLSGVELAHVIVKLEWECPDALQHLREEMGPNDKLAEPPRMEINVDAIPDELFDELSDYVEIRVGNKKPVADSTGKGDESRPKKRRKS